MRGRLDAIARSGHLWGPGLGTPSHFLHTSVSDGTISRIAVGSGFAHVTLVRDDKVGGLARGPAELVGFAGELGRRRVNDQLDVTVHDTEVLAEIEMMTNLIIATSETEGPAVPGPHRRDPRASCPPFPGPRRPLNLLATLRVVTGVRVQLRDPTLPPSICGDLFAFDGSCRAAAFQTVRPDVLRPVRRVGAQPRRPAPVCSPRCCRPTPTGRPRQAHARGRARRRRDHPRDRAPGQHDLRDAVRPRGHLPAGRRARRRHGLHGGGRRPRQPLRDRGAARASSPTRSR